jgi:hypothetical protein
VSWDTRPSWIGIDRPPKHPLGFARILQVSITNPKIVRNSGECFAALLAVVLQNDESLEEMRLRRTVVTISKQHLCEKLSTEVVVRVARCAVLKGCLCFRDSALPSQNCCQRMGRFNESRLLAKGGFETTDGAIIAAIQGVSDSKCMMIWSQPRVASGGLPKLVDRRWVV